MTSDIPDSTAPSTPPEPEPVASASAPAVPKPAASVLLVRESESSAAPIEVYMIRRNKGMRFLGGWYAFPGGKVDPSDATTARVRGLTSEDAARAFSVDDDGLPPLAYWVAAARELLEETGVLLACDAGGCALATADVDAIAACRREVMEGVGFAEALARRTWYCDLAPLRYLSHFVTPTRSPIRFTARFFVCPLPPGQAPRLFTEETSEGFWIAPAEAYRRFVADEMAMAEPAEYAVGYLSQFGSLDELWRAHDDGRARFEGITHRSEAYYADTRWKAARFPDTLPPS